MIIPKTTIKNHQAKKVRINERKRLTLKYRRNKKKQGMAIKNASKKILLDSLKLYSTDTPSPFFIDSISFLESVLPLL